MPYLVKQCIIWGIHFGTRAEMLPLSCTSIFIEICTCCSLQTILTVVKSDHVPLLPLFNEIGGVNPSRDRLVQTAWSGFCTVNDSFIATNILSTKYIFKFSSCCWNTHRRSCTAKLPWPNDKSDTLSKLYYHFILTNYRVVLQVHKLNPIIIHRNLLLLTLNNWSDETMPFNTACCALWQFSKKMTVRGLSLSM